MFRQWLTKVPKQLEENPAGVLHRTAIFSAGAILKAKQNPKAGHLVRRQRGVHMPPFKDMNLSTLAADRFYHD